jgi:hypothetical protein
LVGGGVAIAGILGLLVFALLRRKRTKEVVGSKLEEGFQGAKVHKPKKPIRREGNAKIKEFSKSKNTEKVKEVNTKEVS